VNKVLLSGGIF